MKENNKKYNHKKIEKNWQNEWDKKKIYSASDFSKKPKYYCLIEFPYPSGTGLHIGHLRSHIAIDVTARKKRMEGYNVLYPIGWDAFGLPTENYAIKSKTHPKIITRENIKNFTRQIKSYGPSFDWSREINTTDPEYYKWTQWIFLKLFNSFYDDKLNKARSIEKLKIPKGLSKEEEKRNYIDSKRLAYKTEMAVNWCPSCKIGLSNEEVVNGSCERCGANTEKKMIKQWMLKIVKYADRLIEDLNQVDYPDKIKTQQINWIGKSEGAAVKFKIANRKPQMNSKFFIKVFTTRPDTLFGCTYMVLAPEHSLINKLKQQITNYDEVKKYIERAKNKSDLDRTDLAKEKTGVELKGVKAINPVNNKKIPIWTADYVLASYGTGAIMAVPAHDERDFEFAKKYKIEIKRVVLHNSECFGKTLKSLELLKKINKEAEKKNVKVWLLGGLACAFYAGVIYRNHNDIDLIVKSKTDLSKTEKILKELGMTKINKIKSDDAASVLTYASSNGMEVDLNHWVKKLDKKIDVSEDDFEKNEKQLFGYKSLVLSKKYIRKFKKYQLEKRNKEKDKLDWKFLFLKNNTNKESAYAGSGININSGFLNGLETKEAKKKIIEWLEKNNLGGKAVNYKLRDWVFSRQHYWGEPIPIIKCKKCGNVPLKEEDILNNKLKLPDIKNYKPTDTGESPLAKIDKWVNVKCAKCGGDAKRETDTMPNWAGSSWYFLRYTDPKNNKQFASRKKIDYWMPVDLYNGGMEHTTLHLLYSRFWHKFLYDLGYVNTSEPYKKRRSHGMILSEDGRKMSKSRGNVVNPDEVIEKYGADSLRLYVMFMGPYEEAIPWNVNGIIGIRKFLEKKVWKVANKIIDDIKSGRLINNKKSKLIHKTIKEVSKDIEMMKFNTAVSKLMIQFNGVDGKPDWRSKLNSKGEWERVGEIKANEVDYSALKNFLILLAPFAPHIAEELWKKLGNKESIHLQTWPKYDSELAKEKEIELVIQINGKVRDRIKTSVNISEEEAKEIAFSSEKIKKWIDGKEIKKIIFARRKLINIVV